MEHMKNSRGSKKSTQKSKNTQNVDKIVAAKVNALTKGKVFRPTLILPLFSQQPWNVMTLRMLKSLTDTSILLSAKDLEDPLCMQLGVYLK